MKPTQIIQRSNRSHSSITRGITRAPDNGTYSPFIAESRHLEQQKTQQPHLKMTLGTWNIVKPLLELRWSPEQIAKWLKTEYPQHKMSGKTIYNRELKKLALSDFRRHGKKQKTGKEGKKREDTRNDAYRQSSYRNKQP